MKWFLSPKIVPFELHATYKHLLEIRYISVLFGPEELAAQKLGNFSWPYAPETSLKSAG